MTEDIKSEKVFTLRISQHIFDKVKKAAEIDKRSISKEIEYIIDRALCDNLPQD